MMRLEYGRMLQDGLDGVHGLTRAQLADLGRRFPGVQAEVRARRAAGEYGFHDLAEQGSAIRSITQFASGVGQAFDHVLVLGIGGSALGARALLSALRAPAWNELDDEGRDFYPRLTILDNVDPVSVHAALGRIDPRRVLVNVVSKSGSTAETMAQYLVVRAWLEEALGPAATRHLVFTTDPERGVLRDIARREGIAAVDVPPAVGGRFSVLSPVGLLPAALVGIDIAALLSGAERALRDGGVARPAQQPAGAACGAALGGGHLARARASTSSCRTATALRDVAEWYRQLWAESLGKRHDRRGAEVFTGPTPIGAVGATDQHSQVQLFMEGPFDKVLTLVSVEDHGIDVAIPGRPRPSGRAGVPARALPQRAARGRVPAPRRVRWRRRAACTPCCASPRCPRTRWASC